MIYLDSAATTFQKPAAVQRAVVQAMRTMSSPGRGGYAAAQQADELLFRCRSAAGRRAAVSLPQRSRGALLRAVERAGRFHDERDAWTEHRHQKPCPPVRAGRRLRL